MLLAKRSLLSGGLLSFINIQHIKITQEFCDGALKESVTFDGPLFEDGEVAYLKNLLPLPLISETMQVLTPNENPSEQLVKIMGHFTPGINRKSFFSYFCKNMQYFLVVIEGVDGSRKFSNADSTLFGIGSNELFQFCTG